MPKIGLIVPSARPNRIGGRVAEWVAGVVGQDWDVDVIDLAELNLPYFNEPISPKQQKPRSTDHAKTWGARVDGLDALVVITPEYNGSYPGALKNAIDYLYAELNELPTAVVGYGWGGGQGAIDATVTLLSRLQANVIGEVPLFFRTDLDTEGNLFVTDERREQLSQLGEQLRSSAVATAAA
jgi:NAD(P)H-dependent FMN reductase